MQKYFLAFLVMIFTLMLFTLLLSGCKKNVAATNVTTENISTSVKDTDGNLYDTVIIGTQVWMANNLKTTHYRNGTVINNITDSITWGNDQVGAYCNYNNNSANGNIYGHLYNWYAVNNAAGLCPEGWHIPTDSEWNVLITYLGGDSLAGGNIKSAGTTIWNAPNMGATNSSGFAALPGGNRLSDNSFYGINNYGHFWSSTQADSSIAWSRYLYYFNSEIYLDYSSKAVGFSCRCIRD